MQRYFIYLAYDGTNYHGWQIQPNGSSVQECLMKALSTFLRREVEVIGAGRTDAGVHALGQRAVIDVNTSIPTERIPMALNAFLPDDIVVTAAEDTDKDFNPRFKAVKKTYEYRIYNKPFRNPVYRNYSEYVRENLDIEKMREK